MKNTDQKSSSMKDANRESTDMGDFKHIDYDSCTVHGILKQIRYNRQEVEEENPPLVKCWVATIPTSITKTVVTYLRNYPPDKFPSIKRFQKHNTDPSKLKAVICDTNYKTEDEVRADILSLLGNKDDENALTLTLEEINIPSALPTSKEMAVKWSREFWPMTWKGNPNHQFLRSLNFKPNAEKQMISQLLEAYRSADEFKDKVNSITIIAQETKEGNMEQLYIARDSRQCHPLNHSVMNAIKTVADNERKRREEAFSKATNQYLCLNMVVYTTHEPCTMCCMALVHSRIDRVVYIKDSPQCGGFGSHYQLGDRDGLNWKFQIWKWIGEEEISIAPIDGVNV